MNAAFLGASFYDFTRNCYRYDVVVSLYVFDADFFNFVVHMIFKILTS
jgi:hypothetical protein